MLLLCLNLLISHWTQNKTILEPHSLVPSYLCDFMPCCSLPRSCVLSHWHFCSWSCESCHWPSTFLKRQPFPLTFPGFHMLAPSHLCFSLQVISSARSCLQTSNLVLSVINFNLKLKSVVYMIQILWNLLRLDETLDIVNFHKCSVCTWKTMDGLYC